MRNSQMVPNDKALKLQTVVKYLVCALNMCAFYLLDASSKWQLYRLIASYTNNNKGQKRQSQAMSGPPDSIHQLAYKGDLEAVRVKVEADPR